MISTSRKSLVFASVVAALLLGCTGRTDQAAAEAQPSSERNPAGSTSIPSSWRFFPVSAVGPSLMLVAPAGVPSLVVSCRDTMMKFHVRGLRPEQRWPQPELIVAFGSTERSKKPDVRIVGERPALEMDVLIQDSLLAPLRAGSQITARFADQRLAFPMPPDEMRLAFVEACEAPLPPGMRAG